MAFLQPASSLSAALVIMSMQTINNLDLPTVAELKQAAEAGQRVTAEDVSAISQVENRLTGRGPVRGGPAGMYSPVVVRCFRRGWMLIRE